MTKTVHELRNEIRVAVGRFERETAVAFTKEDLRDISEAVGHEVDTAGRLPPKAKMRAEIREAVGLAEGTRGSSSAVRVAVPRWRNERLTPVRRPSDAATTFFPPGRVERGTMNSGRYRMGTEVVEVDFCDDVLEALDEYAFENGHNTRESVVVEALER